MRLGFSWIEYIERLDNMNTTIYEAVAKYKKDDTLPYVNVNIRMYNFDDVQCTVIPSVAYGFVTGMNLQLC